MVSDGLSISQRQEPRYHHVLWNHQAHQHRSRVQLATHQRVLLAQQGTEEIPLDHDLPRQPGLLAMLGVKFWGRKLTKV